MKLAGPAAARAAQKDLSPHFVMLSGPDPGVLRRLSQAITARHLQANPELEPKRFSEDDLRADNGGVEEAISAPSLFGGAAIAQVRVSSEKDASAMAALLDRVDKGGPAPGGVLIVDVGDIARTSKARKLFEDSRFAWSLQLYEPTREDLLGIAREEAKTAGVTLELDALAAILESAAQDTDSIAAETAKLALYAGPGGTIDMAAIEAVGSGGREAGLDEAIDAAFLGDPKMMAQRLEQALASGANPVAILNAIGRRIRVLLQVRAGIEGGGTAADILKNARLGIFWKKQADVARQASGWGRAPLEDVLSATLEADAQTKRANSPAEAIVERLLSRIAKRGARALRR